MASFCVKFNDFFSSTHNCLYGVPFMNTARKCWGFTWWCCLSVCLSIYLSVCLSICLCFSVRPSVCLFVCPSVCLSVCLSVRLFVCLSVHLFVCLSVCLYVCASVCLSVRMSVRLFVCLSVCPSICSPTAATYWHCCCYYPKNPRCHLYEQSFCRWVHPLRALVLSTYQNDARQPRRLLVWSVTVSSRVVQGVRKKARGVELQLLLLVLVLPVVTNFYHFVASLVNMPRHTSRQYEKQFAARR